MAGTSLSGSFFMPIDMYLKKNEMTCMNNASVDDDAEQLNQYMRKSLIDYRELPSQYEEDQHRADNHSREKLNLRHTGDRNGAVEPWLPDGTFLDQIFLSDQGNSMLPDFQQLRDQINLRVRDKPLYSDEDYSIPTKERSAAESIQVRDQVHRQVQKKLQIFETSRDYLRPANPVGKALLGSKQLKKLVHDQTPAFMNEEASTNRNWQIEYSNRAPVGWQTTPDVVFKISRYDTPRKLADQTADSYKNRIGGRLDTDFLVSFEGKNIPRSLALTIMDIMRQRKRVTNFMRNSGAQYGASEEAANRKIKELDSQVMELMRRHTESSATTSANQLLRSERQNVSGKRYMYRDDPNKKYKSWAGIQLVDLVKKATNNRKLGQQDSQDLRDQIAQTASSDAIFMTDKNRKTAEDGDATARMWESLAEHRRDENMTVFNYSGVKPNKRSQMAGSHNMFVVDEYNTLKLQELTNRRGSAQHNKLYAPDVLSYEKYRTVEVPMHNIGGQRNRHNGLGMTVEENRGEEELADLASTMHTQPGRVYSSAGM